MQSYSVTVELLTEIWAIDIQTNEVYKHVSSMER